jgi:murein L,D-transpeptidase YcbB/YkuD
VQQLKQRLRVTGDLAKRAALSDNFDGDLEAAVKAFQTRHGLTADGIVGQQTLDALNQPISARIDQIRVNLERMRWFLHDIPATFLVVDIAGFHVYLIGEQAVIWDTKAMVGAPYRKTPSFRSKIEYLVINPTWTIPPGILRKDTIPAIKKDPAYLETKNISVLDRKGKVLDRNAIDWSKYSTNNFPFILRQEPGPTNALGLIKFIFPNPHFVFLHDTPSRNLFERTERAFSSGCIRVDQPFTLAEYLLNNPTEWNQKAFQQIVDSGKTKTAFLTEKMTVLLLYWTAHAEEDGTVSFKRDIYGRDENVLKGLEGAFQLHKKLPIKS